MVELKRLSLDDKYEMTRLLNNKKIWDNLRDYIPFPYSVKDAEAYISMPLDQDPQTYFGISYNDKFCGVIGLAPLTDVYKRNAEIGYWLGEEFWRKGIMTKAVALITKFGFDKLNLNRIETGIFEFNIASMRVLEKNDFTKEGVFKKAIIKNDKIWDEHRYAKLNPNKSQS